MPSLTLAIAMSAKYLRQVRATILDELGKEYVAGARGVKFSVLCNVDGHYLCDGESGYGSFLSVFRS